jgi:hypothetical protein
MKPIQVAISLRRLLETGRSFYMKCEPEILDFTSSEGNGELVIFSKDEEFRLPLHPKVLVEYLGLLCAAFFHDKDISIICWNIKNLVSYIKHHTKGLLQPECKVMDLKVIEGFLGVKKQAPASLVESLERLRAVFVDDSWPQAKRIYQKVHAPLIFDVIPSLETQGLYDKESRKALYSYYEIEGQANGRLCNHKTFRNCFVPHSMTPEERNRLRPRGTDEVFVYFDYRHMEVRMLQWLSQDDRLAQILDLDEDLYRVVFKLVSGTTCDTDKKRELCKNFLIGIIYGQSARSLSQTHEISLMTAEAIVGRIYSLFPKALNWIQAAQDGAIEMVRDALGRKRFFEDRQHRVRNFVVQAPASLVCLEKLIQLHNGLKGSARLACHIHDGYIACVNRGSVRMVASLAKDVLESDSELCPGLKLKSSCKVGASLAELKALEGLGTVAVNLGKTWNK